MSQSSARQTLIAKLAKLRETLTPEEQAAFGAMVKLAAGVAEAVVVENPAPGEAAVLSAGALLKTQSKHAALTTDEMAALLKTQSSHAVFSLTDLKKLV